MEKIKGTGVALITPFNADLSVDYVGLERLLNHQIKGGIDYLVLMGTTGESAVLSKSEKNEVIVYIPLERLEMESHIAMALIEQLYPVEDYEDIWIDHQGKNIVFDMTHEGTKPQKDPKPPSNSHWGAGGA